MTPLRLAGAVEFRDDQLFEEMESWPEMTEERIQQLFGKQKDLSDEDVASD